MAIQMRRGLRADFDPTKLVAGEWAVSVDSSTQNQIVWMCFGAGVVKRMGTYEDFQAMIAEISEDLEADFETELRASVNTILSEVQSLADDVSDDADAVATARTAIESTDIPAIQALITQAQTYASNADTSAQSASSSAQSASNSASSASSSATSAESSKNTASAKATEAQSWAVGGTGTRSGEDTNNAKYWSERAQSTSLAQSDWTEDDTTSSSYINHKPFKTVGTGLSVDSNGALNVSNPGTTNYNDLSNKPSINGIALSGNKTLHDLGAQAEGNYLESGDVPSWAMQPQKPTYNASEVGALPDTTPIPSKTSDLQNDSGFITDIALATSNTAGKVKPDNTSITVDANGTLSVIGGGGSGDVSYEELNVLGAKNLLGNNATTTVVNGVTFTVNADGSVNANGTASADISFTLNSDVDIPSGDYKLSGCPEGGNANTYSLVLTDTTASTSTVCTGADASVTINSAHTYTASISIKSGTSVSNKLYKPMIRLASITDDTYTPYAMTNQALTKETTNLTQSLDALLVVEDVQATVINGTYYSITGQSITCSSNSQFFQLLGRIDIGKSDGTAMAFATNTWYDVAVISASNIPTIPSERVIAMPAPFGRTSWNSQSIYYNINARARYKTNGEIHIEMMGSPTTAINTMINIAFDLQCLIFKQ